MDEIIRLILGFIGGALIFGVATKFNKHRKAKKFENDLKVSEGKIQSAEDAIRDIIKELEKVEAESFDLDSEEVKKYWKDKIQ